jgi:hypothetical protein
VDDASPIDHLLFRLRRDDGAVLYLNGQEIYRENMPAGIVQPSTLALADIFNRRIDVLQAPPAINRFA